MTKRGQVLDIQRLIKLGQWVDDYLLKQVSIPVYYNWPMAFYGLKRLVTFDDSICSIFNIMGILHTGHLAMCGIGVQVPELCYGLLGKDHVADVWTSNPILIDLRKMLPTELEGICRECIFRNRCLGTCVAANYHLSGCLTTPFWFCQMADEAGVFPTSRRRSGQSKKISAADPSTHLSETGFMTKEERRLLNEV
jgi:radical SAM protein with 4Fe4S-binding SPASM domain